ncbi:hypothetical protein ACFLWC_02895 [Chloroflexota bacterium]
MKNESNPEKDLLHLINEVGQKGREIVEKSNWAAKLGQEYIDLSDESNNLFSHGLPNNIDIDRQLGAWGYAYGQEIRILESFNNIPPALASTATTNTADAMLDYSNPEKITEYYPLDKHEDVRIASAHLNLVINKQVDKQKVILLLQEHNLVTAAPGIKSPLELFETSWSAFEKPVNQGIPASTSLIPMRECINTVIDRLIKHRPCQERARGERNKIHSILNQLRRADVTEYAISSLSERWSQLNNELSDSKQRNYDRPRWTDYQQRATLFLLELLQSIDRSKYR